MIDAVNRRGLLKSIVVLAGVVATPAAAQALFDGPQSLPGSTMALLTAVADTMIPATDTPGAIGAGVPAAFDKLVANWASPKRRGELLAALAAIDAKAGGFAALPPAERLAVLDAHDRASAAPPVATQLKDEKDEGMAGSPGYTPDAKVPAQDPTPDYAKLKELLVTLYYFSEAGATVELRYEHNPGAWEPSIAVTADTRNYGGPGGL
jgi:hypothetical protein